jgi:hypothetical protein
MNINGWDEAWFYRVKCVFPSHGPSLSSIDSFDIMNLSAPPGLQYWPETRKQFLESQRRCVSKLTRKHPRHIRLNFRFHFSTRNRGRRSDESGAQLNWAVQWVSTQQRAGSGLLISKSRMKLGLHLRYLWHFRMRPSMTNKWSWVGFRSAAPARGGLQSSAAWRLRGTEKVAHLCVDSRIRRKNDCESSCKTPNRESVTRAKLRGYGRVTKSDRPVSDQESDIYALIPVKRQHYCLAPRWH